MAAEDLTNVRWEAFGTDFVWSQSHQAWVCQECGTLAEDQGKHGRYHAALAGRLNDHDAIALEPPPSDSSWLEMEPAAGPGLAKLVRETLRARGRRVR